MGADCVFEMDADFSHDPKYIPQFLSAIKEHEVIIGSRYIPGGGTENWSRVRQAISRGGNLYTRLSTGLRVKDSTSGFRCYRGDVLGSIDFSRISASGYAFQVEMAYVCSIMGFEIYEIPIVFTDRVEGQSKMSRQIVWEAMGIVGGLKKKYRGINNKSS
jgi:dolichol-phosphate mannosyltransferase